VRDERAVLLDPAMQRGEPVAVPVHGKVRNDPDHLAQEHDDGGDVEKSQAQRLRPQIHHGEPGRTPRRAGALRIPGSTDRLRSHHEVGQLPYRTGTDLLRQVGAAGHEYPGLAGTGDSAVPADPATYRCDQQVDDVEALRRHLGLDRLDLLGHPAGASLALGYAAQHPDRVGRLVLVGPSPFGVGVEVADEDRRELAELRRGEPWFPAAFAAFERIWSGEATAADWAAIAPFRYGRWDAQSRAQHAATADQRNADAAAAFYADGRARPGRRAVRDGQAGCAGTAGRRRVRRKEEFWILIAFAAERSRLTGVAVPVRDLW
jgi:pimeloyl-ACP methyl ester carboxylesterase